MVEIVFYSECAMKFIKDYVLAILFVAEEILNSLFDILSDSTNEENGQIHRVRNILRMPMKNGMYKTISHSV